MDKNQPMFSALTKREIFAAFALAGIMAAPHEINSPEITAATALIAADALIAALARKKEAP